MQAYRVETIIHEDGSLLVKDVPFPAGEVVEVIILTQQPTSTATNSYPLRGTKVEYHDPFKPVGESDWDACQ